MRAAISSTEIFSIGEFHNIFMRLVYEYLIYLVLLIKLKIRSIFDRVSASILFLFSHREISRNYILFIPPVFVVFTFVFLTCTNVLNVVDMTRLFY